MVAALGRILRVDVFAAHLPDERVEPIVEPLPAHLVEDLDLAGVRRKVAPHIVVDGHDHLAPQRLRHAQDIHRGHLVGDAHRVFAVGAERHVDVIVLAVFGKINGIVAVAAVVDVAAAGLDQVVDRLVVHIAGAGVADILLAVGGHQTGAVERVQGHQLHVLDFDRVAGLHDDAAPPRHPPADPGLHRFQRPDKGDVPRQVPQHMGGQVRVHVVLVIVGGDHRVQLFYRKGVQHMGDGPQVGLQLAAAAHVGHLVPLCHQLARPGALAVAGPKIHAQVAAALALDPHAGAAQPPHGHVARSDDLLFDLLIQPGAPFRKCAHDPGLPRDLIDFAHLLLSSACRPCTLLGAEDRERRFMIVLCSIFVGILIIFSFNPKFNL